MLRKSVGLFGLALMVVNTVACAQGGPSYSHIGDSLVSGIRLIDGLGNAPKENQDILIVDGNPLEDITVIGANSKWFDAEPPVQDVPPIRLIMKDGKVFKNTLR